ncbi:hypothetical protein NKR23_g7916 [Pleurostoma richardsiae]|uniref:DUF5672 domain-containing protein n=1 Tax=Pleurostoma richardsiae TaxID=41990 RepID=A0AA38R980_9PEZI|nr:hypothetical protein NKR23_g7916 [Pleurostoma richardsiae]
MGVAIGPGSTEAWPRSRKTVLSLLGALILVWLLGTSHIFRPEVAESSKAPEPLVQTGQDVVPVSPAAIATPLATPTPDKEAESHINSAISTPQHATVQAPAAVPAPPQDPPVLNMAVLMETDPNRVPSLVPIMLHFANVLGPKWPVVLLTAQENWSLPDSRVFRRMLEEGRIRIKFLPQGTKFPNHHSVSAFLTQPWIWEQFQDANRVLLFQTDSILCTKSEHTVDDFLQYDLIGAPIAMRHGHGYNGGLSLRNPKVMLEVSRRWGAKFLEEAQDGRAELPNEVKFEDQWFYGKLREMKATLPPVEVAQTFAVESIDYERPLGYHQPQRWQAGNIDKISEWCPEIWMLGDRRF